MSVPLTSPPRALLAALGLGFSQIAGCTTMLGIDGEYDLAADGNGGRTSAVGGNGVTGGSGGNGAFASENGGATTDTGGAGGGVATGGTVGASGASGTGGAIEPSSGGSTGAPPVDAGAPLEPCTPGGYEGTQTGKHAPTLTVFLGYEFKVDGTVKFRLEQSDGGTSPILDGNVKGNLTLLTLTPPVTAPFTATLTGSVNCATGQFEGALEGKYWVTATTTVNPAGTFHGTHSGTFSNGAFSGTWTEQEPTAPPPPTNPTGRGKGTWNASRSGP